MFVVGSEHFTVERVEIGIVDGPPTSKGVSGRYAIFVGFDVCFGGCLSIRQL